MGIKVTGNHEVDQATAEIAVALRDGGYGRRGQDRYDEAVRLRDAIMAGTRELDAAEPADRDPGWFRAFMEDGCKDEPVDLRAGLVPGGGAEVSNDGSFDYRERT